MELTQSRCLCIHQVAIAPEAGKVRKNKEEEDRTMIVALKEIRMINEVDRTKAEEGMIAHRIKDKTATAVALVEVIAMGAALVEAIATGVPLVEKIAMGVPLVETIAMGVPLVQVTTELATRTDPTTTTAGMLILPHTALDPATAVSLLETEDSLVDHLEVVDTVAVVVGMVVVLDEVVVEVEEAEVEEGVEEEAEAQTSQM